MAKRKLSLLGAVFAALVCMMGLMSFTAFADDTDYGYFGCIEDHQDALTDSEEAQLLTLLDDTARSIHANVGVIFADSYMDGMSEVSYTKSFLNRSFGEYSDSVVLMMVQTGSGKVDQIYATDAAYDKYHSKTDRIFDYVYDGFDSGSGENYYAAVEGFCNYLSGHPVDGIEFHLNLGHIVGTIAALIAAIAIANGHAASYRKKLPISARAYMKNDMTHFIERNDVFVREYTTSHRVSSSSSGGRGGGHGGGGHHGGGGGGRRR